MLKLEFDLGEIEAGKDYIREIEFPNDSEYYYKITKFMPYCPCISTIEFSDNIIAPKDSFKVKFKIKKSYLGAGSTKIDFTLGSPYADYIYGVITIKYNVIVK